MELPLTKPDWLELPAFTGQDVGYAIGAVFACSILYSLGLGIYRLYFHPLAKFPGRKIAIFTQWYEFYFDIIKHGGGLYSWEIEKMHEQYGPVIRITPDEIHVNDPDWYEVLYAGAGQLRDKHAPVARMVGTPLGVFGSIPHQDHRKRRGTISPFFSKRSVTTNEELLHSKVDLLCAAIQEQAKKNGIVEVRACFLGFATDVTCQYALGDSPHPDLLRNPDSRKEWQGTLHAMEHIIPLIKQIPWALPIALKFPSWVYAPFSSVLEKLVILHENMQNIASKELADDSLPITEKEDKESKEAKTIFQMILQSNMIPSEKSHARLTHEGLNMISAGGETVSRVLGAGIFHLISNPDALARLRDEVDPIFASTDQVTVKQLEALPWLTAVLKESLRIGAVVLTRLPLVSPQKPLVYEDFTIPAGTPVSMTPARLLHDSRCFDEPYAYRPERWLGTEAEVRKAEKYFFPFSRGGRNCLGQNLAWAELYLVMATMTHRFDMELYDTIRERDIDHKRDFFIGKPDPSTQGIRLKIQRRNTANES